MNHGSLFSGIGGFDLPSEWMGWDNVFHCEMEEFPRKILNHYWPKSISYEDITKTDFTIHRGKIDVLTGGFPCQPYSTAGKRLGKEDERHLWPEMLRAIQEIQPRWVVGENVRGLVSWNGGLVFDEVQADLETQGYEIQPFILPACSVNAPHRRDRVWFIAYSNNFLQSGGLADRENKTATRRSKESNKLKRRFKNRKRIWYESSAGGKNASCANKEGLERGFRESLQRRGSRFTKQNWCRFPTQPPVCSRNDGVSGGLDGITFPRWRQESIKAYGNAVVPQLVYQIFKAIEKYENL